MDIIYKLPLPDEICSKILIYSCKSSHTDLGLEILKREVSEHWRGMMNYGGVIEPKSCKHDHELIKFAPENYEEESDSFIITMDLYMFSRFTAITTLILSNTWITGDISVIQPLQNLETLSLFNTSVTGDISVLKSFLNLNTLFLQHTYVSGDISVLKLLSKVIYLCLDNTYVTGDISVLKSLPNLNTFNIKNTDVIGSHGLPLSSRRSIGFTYVD
jgi:Leucine-rich repeat (LRR) protein